MTSSVRDRVRQWGRGDCYDVYLLPQSLNEKVAPLHLPALDAQTTIPTTQQVDLVGVPVWGPSTPRRRSSPCPAGRDTVRTETGRATTEAQRQALRASTPPFPTAQRAAAPQTQAARPESKAGKAHPAQGWRVRSPSTSDVLQT